MRYVRTASARQPITSWPAIDGSLGHSMPTSSFGSRWGRAVEPATMSAALTDACDAAGLGHWTPHELRHSAASLLLASGVPLVQVADFLGHSSATVTASVYAHVLDDARTSTAAAMSVVLTSG